LAQISSSIERRTELSYNLWKKILAVILSALILSLICFSGIIYMIINGPSESVKKAFFFGGGLFYVGCAIGYILVFPLTFRFLTQYQIGESVMNQISLNSYMSNFLTLVFIMGIVFEMPMLAWILSSINILHKGTLKSYRKIAVVILLVLSALITPSGDPFTLSIVFLPLYLLYELSILVVREEDTSD